MQFKSIIAVLSFALVATSVPTGTSTTTTTTTAAKCSGDNTASYCSKNQDGGLLGIVTAVLAIIVPVKVSDVLTCTTVLPILSNNQQVANACCPNSGSQSGLVNIGTVCVPLTVG